jgi:MFS family permease
LTILYTIAESQGALMWGLLSDRTGFRIVFLCSLGTWALGNAVILYGNTLGSAYAVFILVGAGFSGFMLASQNLVLEFGDQADRPMRIAATNGISELFGVASFLGAGLLSDTAPLSWIFAASILLIVAAAVVMWRVRDPRAGTSFA